MGAFKLALKSWRDIPLVILNSTGTGVNELWCMFGYMGTREINGGNTLYDNKVRELIVV